MIMKKMDPRGSSAPAPGHYILSQTYNATAVYFYWYTQEQYQINFRLPIDLTMLNEKLGMKHRWLKYYNVYMSQYIFS